jgi:hypothetical protein
VKLGLTLKGGKQIFWFDQIMKNMVVNVTRTKSAITRDIVEGAVAAVLALIAVAGPIIEGLTAATEITEVTDEGGEAIIDSEAFEEVAINHPEEEVENELNAAENAAEQSGGKLTNIKNAFNTPKWKFVGVISGIAGPW